MRPTQVGTAVDRLLAVLQPLILPPRLLFDGPQVDGDAATDAGDAVFVGWSGDLQDFSAADFTQTWRGVGARRKDETFDVRNAVVVWNGDTDPAATKLRRDAALATFAIIEAALRADPGQGQPGPSIYSVVGGSLVQEPAGRTRIPFTVSVRARI